MRKEIFQVVKNVVLNIKDENGESLIKHVDLFNQQILFITQERPFDTPAVFIDFERIDWHYLSQGVREADVTFNLYVVVDSMNDKYADSLNVFDLHNEITATLWNIAETHNMGAITLQSSTTDNEFDELRADVDTYVCHVVDYSTMKRNGLE